MTENDMMILEIQNNRYLVTPKTEKFLKTYLFERYKKNKDITVKVFDYDTNELLDELPLNALYSE